MGRLSDVIADSSVNAGKFNNPVGGKKQPKGKYIALALVPKNTISDFGTSYTPPGGTATTVTGQSIVTLLTLLTMKGTAWFLGNGLVNGKRSKPQEMKNGALYGTETTERPTGEVKEAVVFDIKWFYQNRDFFNSLRYNYTEFDLYIFTDRSVELVRYDDCLPVFSDIGDETPGDINRDIAGSFTVTYSNDGQIQPVFGINETSLSASNFKITFGAVTATTITNVAGTERYNMTSGTGGTITRAVNQTDAAGLKYSIFLSDGSSIPAGQPVTINANTGLVTIGNALTAGSYTYVVMVENPTGVTGQHTIYLTVA